MELADFISIVGKGRDGYRDQIVTCDVGVSPHSKTHPLFVKCAVMAQVTYQYPSLFPVLFLQSLYLLFQFKEFFIYLYITFNKNRFHLRFCMFCCAGESGLVYCGYLDSGGGGEMVAVKTCRGKEYPIHHSNK